MTGDKAKLYCIFSLMYNTAVKPSVQGYWGSCYCLYFQSADTNVGDIITTKVAF